MVEMDVIEAASILERMAQPAAVAPPKIPLPQSFCAAQGLYNCPTCGTGYTRPQALTAHYLTRKHQGNLGKVTSGDFSPALTQAELAAFGPGHGLMTRADRGLPP